MSCPQAQSHVHQWVSGYSSEHRRGFARVSLRSHRSGRNGASLRHSPLRTVLAGFLAHGSSNSLPHLKVFLPVLLVCGSVGGSRGVEVARWTVCPFRPCFWVAGGG